MLSKISIRTKLAGVATVLIAGFSLFILVEVPSKLMELESTAIADKAQSIAEMTAYSISPALLFEDRLDAEQAMSNARQNKDVVYLIILDSVGREFCSFYADPGYHVSHMTETKTNKTFLGGTVYQVVTGIRHNDREIGRLYLGMSLQSLNKHFSESRNGIALVSLLMFIIGMGAVFGISTIITKPLSRMVETASRIVGGDLSQRTIVSSQDEVGRLATSFNTMVHSLEAAHRDLESANRDLEARVKARTMELQQEIFERTKTEEVLRQSEERFRLITENAGDLISVVDLEGRRLYNSPSYRSLLGDPEQARGSDGFQEIHPDDREKTRRVFKNIIKTGVGNRTEYRFLMKDGSVRHIESQGSLIRDAQGLPARVVIVSRDITERKVMEERIRQAQKMEGIGTLAGGIAHDFNNILNIILSYTVLLGKSRDDPERFSEGVGVIKEAVKRAAGVVRQLLTFARKAEISFEALDVNQAIGELTKMLRETFPRTISFVLNLAKELPCINGDPNQMQQVFLNLCVNARDVMPSGGTLTIATELVPGIFLRELFPGARQAEYVHISITDTGSGIDEETKRHIFEPFFTTKEQGKGTGLGLAVAYGVIRSHNGFIDLETAEGVGTTFRIYLPVPVRTIVTDGAGQGETSITLDGTETLLVVEDEEKLRDSLRVVLEGKGYHVLTARDGMEAVDLYRQNKDEVALVLSDIGLPKLNGWDAFLRMKAMNSHLKIIFMSGYLDPHLRIEIAKAGENQFLQKPFVFDNVLVKVRELIQSSDN